MSDWKLIETAPRDGQSILVINGAWRTVAVWHRVYDMWVTNGPVYSPYPNDEQPTHWMSLPAPPIPTEPETIEATVEAGDG